MRCLIAFTTAMVVLIAGVPGVFAGQLHVRTGESFTPDSLLVSTWIDDRIGVTEVVEVFNIEGLAIPAEGLQVVLIDAVDPRSAVTSAAVEVNGVWQVATVVSRTQIDTLEDGQWVHALMPPTNRTPVILSVRLPIGANPLVRTKVSYAAMLPASACSIRYTPPTRWSALGKQWTPDHWEVEVRTTEAVIDITTRLASNGEVDIRAGLTSFSIAGSTSVDDTTDIDLVVSTEPASVDMELTVGWKDKQAYGIAAGRTECGVDPNPTSARKIWVVIDDRRWTPDQYTQFKKLCLETIDQLDDDDDFDVFLYDGVKSFHSWLAHAGSRSGGPQAAGAWMMQSNGFTNTQSGPRPAEWLLSHQPAVTEDLDVIFLSYAKGARSVGLVDSEISAIRDRGIRFHSLILAQPFAANNAYQRAAEQTGGAWTIDPVMSNLPSVVRKTMNVVKALDTRLGNARSLTPAFSIVVPWASSRVDSSTPGVLAMRLDDWGRGNVAVDGFLAGSPHRWHATVDATGVRMFSTYVPLLWAHAFIRNLQVISSELEDVPSALAEIQSQIVSLGIEFGIGSSEVAFSVAASP